MRASEGLDEMAVRIAIMGAGGRMGSRIDALAEADADVRVVGRIGRDSDPAALASEGIDVVVDFSSEAGTRRAIDFARRAHAALLVGTTGLSAETAAALRELAATNAVLVAPNTSLGVAVTRALARLASELLEQAGWKVDIVESHHDRKKDAPSGTALAIARSVEAGGMPVPSDRIHAIRAGDTIGEHEIRFAGPCERLHISHQAVSRDLFATGALRAAKWLASRPAGQYSMEDVLLPAVTPQTHGSRG
jgi:4-hydroxy-tetrahydrodipicolinate reductase